MPNSKIILTPLQKALDSLVLALEQPEDEFIRDACIQRFEYTDELCWKLLKRYLSEEADIQEYNIKSLYHEGARQNLIQELDNWFEYHKARNLTSHTDSEETAEETYQLVKRFAIDAKNLLTNLEKGCGYHA